MGNSQNRRELDVQVQFAMSLSEIAQGEIRELGERMQREVGMKPQLTLVISDTIYHVVYLLSAMADVTTG